jgi:phosphoglycolate phosphatase-like HAD superfamily hydrolase
VTTDSPAPRLVVFDLGGTTVRDTGDVPEAFVEALAAAGLHIDAGDINAARGASKREVIRRVVAERQPSLPSKAQEALAAKVYRDFREALAGRLGQATDLAIPGVARAFERLKTAGVRVALNSGSRHPRSHPRHRGVARRLPRRDRLRR